MLLHPSYSDLIKVVNGDVEEGETPVVNSRYSIVMATAKRARQVIARQANLKEDMKEFKVSKPLSKAVDELYSGQLKILPEEEETDTESGTETETVSEAEAGTEAEAVTEAEAETDTETEVEAETGEDNPEEN